MVWIGIESLATVVAHEVGHCIGVNGHVPGGGLMDVGSNASSVISTRVKNMIGLLYSLPPGTDIRKKLARKKARAEQLGDQWLNKMITIID